METEASQQFCLRWHNHQSSVLGGLPALLDSGRLTDVTLCAGGRSLRAHRIVLSTCSPYFMDIFKELPQSQQPVIVVLGGGWAELCCLVAFMYAGEVTLPRALLPGLLRLARSLRITGLTDLNGNIPEVPMQSEFEDTFDNKFESNYPTPDETTLNRQNDSAGCTENISPFQKSFESHLAAKNLETSSISQPIDPSSSNAAQDESFQGIQLLKHLSLKHDKESCVSVKEELSFDSERTESSGGKFSKKTGKYTESKRYLNPVLNEIEPKNRKIDKIVENLKCNQRKSQESFIPIIRGKTQLSDLQKSYLNLSSSMEVERTHSAQKSSISDGMPSSSKAADIFAGSNIFMETDTDNTGCDTPNDNPSTSIKNESESSPEIIPDLKYVPLSPGMQPIGIGIHSPTNTKLYATCYVCHKQLSNQYNLRVHLETHQNARHACVACSHVSRSRDALRKHVSYRHPQLNTSHGVGRPCKSSLNIQSNAAQSTLQTPPNTSLNVFNFPTESIDLSANSTRSGQNASSANNYNFSSKDSNNTSQSGGTDKSKDDKK